MNSVNIQHARQQGKGKIFVADGWDHYLALDWSMKTMAIARMSAKQAIAKVIERPADVQELKAFLLTLPGKKVLAIEETTSTHWLYVELHEYVDRIVVCDPYRNRLLSDGPKTDPIDAAKLCLLLKGGLLKEVYHTLEKDYALRKLVSAYNDTIQAGVRMLNQRSAFERAEGNQPTRSPERHLQFVREHLDNGIDRYEQTRTAYQTHFRLLAREDVRIRHQATLPGIGITGAVKIVATVLDPHRFPDRGHYWAYCGLVWHQKTSGGRSYGQRRPRFDRVLKSVYKTAALAVLNGKSELRDYYDRLRATGVAEHHARHALARKIATISLGLWKNNTAYRPPERKKETTTAT